ncbi:MAG: hypothetical protein ACE5H1_06775 [Thermodesulfobacteriota bacterium]
MKIHRYFSFVLVLLLISVEAIHAASIIGRVAVYSSPSNPKIYPLVSGNEMTFNHKALIRISGGTILAEEGTVLEALDKGAGISFQIEKGILIFRFLPHKIIVSFETKNGIIFSPQIIKANTSVIEGRIAVSEKDTILQLTKGTMEVITSNGATSIDAGEKFLLAQAVVDKSQQNDGYTSAQVLEKEGTYESPKMTDGQIDKKSGYDLHQVNIDGDIWDVFVVDNNNIPINGVIISKGEEVEVVGVSEGILLVQPKDEELLASILLKSPTTPEMSNSSPLTTLSAVGLTSGVIIGTTIKAFTSSNKGGGQIAEDQIASPFVE